MTYNGKSYSNPKNITLKEGLLRFGDTHTANPFGDLTYGLYVDESTGNLIYRSLTTSTTLGSSGPGSTPSWDAIYNGDKTLTVSSTTLTFNGTHASNDVLTITNTGAGSGDLIQITNSGSGKDIIGTSSTWSFSATGDLIANKVTFAGDNGADSITLTIGDVAISDGSVTVIDADNAASLSVTNNTATTASVFVFAGSAAFTGNTTSSFMTLTSGATTGTVLYIPVAGLTTGKGINLIGTTALTTGIMLNIESGTTGTSLTTTGRMLYVNHTGTGTSTGTLSEFASAAADETVILKVTASGALALGTALAISGSAITTGFGLTLADLDALTDGYGVHIKSTATALSSTGRLLLVEHATSATTTSGVIAEFKTAATDETVLVKLTTAAMINGVALSIVGTTGMTSGSLIRATSSTAGAVATNGVYSFGLTGAFTSTADTLGAFHIAGATTVTGTIMSILGGAQTTGIGLHITDPSTGMTSGSLLRIATASTGAVATNGIVSIRATGAYTSTSNAGLLDVLASGTTAGTVVNLAASNASQTATTILNIVQSGVTTGFTGSVMKLTSASTTGTGNGLLVTMVNTTAGDGIKIVSNALTLGAGTGLLISHTTSVLGAGTSLARISSTGIDTGTTTGTLLDLAQTAAVGNVAMLLTDSSADTAARWGIKVNITNAAAIGAVPFLSSSVAVTGTGSKFVKGMGFYNGTKTNYIWTSIDATTPNGALTATAGDICLNGPSSVPYYCTGTNVWVALA